MIRRGRGRTPWSTSVTRTGTTVAVLALALGAISARQSNPWLLLVACGMAAAVLVSLLLRPGAYHVELAYPTRATAGQTVQHTVLVRNDGRRSLPAARVRHELRGFQDVELATPALPPGGQAELTLDRPALARGRADTSEFTIETGAPLGLTHRTVTTRGPVSIIVRPAWAHPATQASTGQGERHANRPARSGHELHGLREYRPGDDKRHVHWRGTARHGALVVVVPEDTQDPRLALVLAGASADPEWERLVAVAAATAVDALRHGHELLVSAPGVPDLIDTDPGAVLDWFGELGELPPATPEAVRAAGEWAGGDGVVAVAATRPGLVETPHAAGRLLLLGPDGAVSPA